MSYTRNNIGGGLFAVTDDRNYYKWAILPHHEEEWQQISLTTGAGQLRGQTEATSSTSYTKSGDIGGGKYVVSQYDLGWLRLAQYARGYHGLAHNVHLPLGTVAWDATSATFDVRTIDRLAWILPIPLTFAVRSITSLAWSFAYVPTFSVSARTVVEWPGLRWWEIRTSSAVEFVGSIGGTRSFSVRTRSKLVWRGKLGTPIECLCGDGEQPPPVGGLGNYAF